MASGLTSELALVTDEEKVRRGFQAASHPQSFDSTALRLWIESIPNQYDPDQFAHAKIISFIDP
jgi:hypothetical protein